MTQMPHLCCGLSGCAEILLDAHRVIDDAGFEDRAKQLAATVELIGVSDANEGLTWRHVEEGIARTPTADLMIGSGGLVHLFARLEYPDLLTSLPLGLAV